MSEPKFINADDAVDYLKGWVYPSKRDKKFVEAIMKFIEWYPAAPVALTSLSKAHWIIRNPKGKEKQEKPYCYHEDKCGHCGCVFYYDYRDRYDACEDFDFCPKCGARMEYPDESEEQQ